MVRDARLQKEYSQEYAAHFLGISQSKYSRLEKGEAMFELERVKQGY